MHLVETASQSYLEPLKGKKGTERILLVDDDKKVAFMETHLLEKLGYMVTCFTSSFEALHVFSINPILFDFIITDLTMPELTGIQLAKKIYQYPAGYPCDALHRAWGCHEWH